MRSHMKRVPNNNYHRRFVLNEYVCVCRRARIYVYIRYTGVCAGAYTNIIYSVYEKYKCIIVTCVGITDLCMYLLKNNKLN